MKEFENLYPNDKIEAYSLMKEQLKSLVEDESDLIANLSNTSALLNMGLQNINWVGFYLLKNDALVLGPFQGKPACVRIPVGKGVCGTAVATMETQLVHNVHEFPGHIACDSASNSEIVIPIIVNNKVHAVLDIDSPMYSRFDSTDRNELEEIVNILVQSCQW